MSQLIQQYPPLQIALPNPISSATRLIHSYKANFLLANPSKNTLTLYKKSNPVYSVQICPDLDTAKMLIHPNRSNEGPILLIPSTSHHYPYLFDQEDLSFLTQPDYL